MVMWTLSKCVHIAGVGFVRRPWAKVSAASRKLKSSGVCGSGTGKNGRMARRSRSTDPPATATAKRFLLARRAKADSMRVNHAEQNCGQRKDKAAVAIVNPTSTGIKTERYSGRDIRNIEIPHQPRSNEGIAGKFELRRSAYTVARANPMLSYKRARQISLRHEDHLIEPLAMMVVTSKSLISGEKLS